MNIKNYLVAGLIVSLLGGTASLALANEKKEHVGIPPMIMEINKDGKVTLRGTLKAIAPNLLTVTSWGGDWTINTKNATVKGAGDISQFKVGDFVGVAGKVDQSASFTINATTVVDWSLVNVGQAIQQEIRTVKQTERERNWQGTASNVNTASNSFTLTIEGKAYTVNVTTDAVLVNNEKSRKITLSEIKDGDSVRVWGSLSGTTLTVKIVRDTSIH